MCGTARIDSVKTPRKIMQRAKDTSNKAHICIKICFDLDTLLNMSLWRIPLVKAYVKNW